MNDFEESADPGSEHGLVNDDEVDAGGWRRAALATVATLALAVLVAFLAPGSASAAGSAAGPEAGSAAGSMAVDPARPENGAVVVQRGSGAGEFTVDNSGSDQDAAVTLSRDGRSVLTMYVHGRASATASDVPDGTFDVYVERGRTWNGQARHFAPASAAARFDRRAEFRTEETDDGVRYSRLTLTLHAVPGGNARLAPVPSTALPS